MAKNRHEKLRSAQRGGRKSPALNTPLNTVPVMIRPNFAAYVTIHCSARLVSSVSPVRFAQTAKYLFRVPWSIVSILFI